MEKADRALIETENNAAAIRALQKALHGIGATPSVDLTALRSQVNKNTQAIAQVKTTADSGEKEISEIKKSVSANTNAVAEVRSVSNRNTQTIVDVSAALSENTQAITDMGVAVDGNTQAIAELQRSGGSSTFKVLSLDYTKDYGRLSFGKLKSGGNSVLVIRFDTSTAVSVSFGETELVTNMKSPIVTVLPEGEGSLAMYPAQSGNLRVIAFGDFEVTKHPSEA